MELYLLRFFHLRADNGQPMIEIQFEYNTNKLRIKCSYRQRPTQPSGGGF